MLGNNRATAVTSDQIEIIAMQALEKALSGEDRNVVKV